VLKFPAIDIAEVGAGGGSIAWLDPVGAIKIGPHSAGAIPGPACYDCGGEEPTVTDANVVLGFLNDRGLADGTLRIVAERAKEAIARHIAGPLGRDLLETAYGIHTIANTVMMRAVKSVTTYRGRDPREFVLFAFGGNGGVHGAELARSLGIARVVVPPAAGVLSAVGLLFAPQELVLSQGFLRGTEAVRPGDLAQEFRRLEALVVAQMDVPETRISFRRRVDLRFSGQAYEITVEAPDAAIDTCWIADIEARFMAEHDRMYGRRHGPKRDTEIVALRVAGAVATGDLPQIGRKRALVTCGAERQVYFGSRFGMRTSLVAGREALTEARQPGPLIIEEYEATIVVPPDCHASLDAGGNVVIDIGTNG
jgi:N-methylhydantoinase A